MACPSRTSASWSRIQSHDLTASSSRGVHEDVMALCYRSQCLRTAEAFAAGAGLEDGRWSVSFQSRLGRNKWIEPYTEAQLDELVQAGRETAAGDVPGLRRRLHRDAGRNRPARPRAVHRAAGGEELVLVPCLNDQELWARALAKLCERTPAAI